MNNETCLRVSLVALSSSYTASRIPSETSYTCVVVGEYTFRRIIITAGYETEDRGRERLVESVKSTRGKRARLAFLEFRFKLKNRYLGLDNLRAESK